MAASRKRQPQSSESEIQKSCLEYLRVACGWPVWRFNSGAMIMNKRFVRFHTARGCSDLAGLIPPSGRFLAVEVKRPGNEATELQQGWLDEVARSGGLALVIHSVGELQERLREAGYDVP